MFSMWRTKFPGTWRASLAMLLGLAVSACAGSRPAGAPITVTVNTTAPGAAIPPNFAGLSVETGAERPGNASTIGYFLSPQNTELVTLFRNLGIRSLRVGGGSVDDETQPGTGQDGYVGVDNLFGFAQSAGVQVIYSLRLLNPKGSIPNLPQTDATIAKYIWTHYHANLQAFAIGNEPDWNSYHHSDPNISGYSSYLGDWTNFANTIRQAVPQATFAGPDTGDYTGHTYLHGESWTQLFAQDMKSSGLVSLITQHDYVGGGPGSTTAAQAIADMLSRPWVTGTALGTGPEGPSTYSPYPWLWSHNLEPVTRLGLPYRLTEANDYVGGVAGASDSFASALWALDYMHWWAEHGAAGVNFHNKQWLVTDTIVPSSTACIPFCQNFKTQPKGYGIKAFNVGSQGNNEPLTMRNPTGANVTAYAVGSGATLYVTLINKTYGALAKTATVTIVPKGITSASVREMVLTDGQPGNPSLLSASFGGASIPNNCRWQGTWTPLPPEKNGRVTVRVQATTAAVVELQAPGSDSGPVSIEANGDVAAFRSSSTGSVSETTVGGKAPTGAIPLPSGVAAKGSPAVAQDPGGTLTVFVPSAQGVAVSTQTSPNGPFGPWQILGGPPLRDLVASSAADGSLIVFGLGERGHIWTDSEIAPGAAWASWTDLGGQAVEPGFAVGQNPSGLLTVIGVGSGGQVWARTQATPASWGTWESLGGDVSSKLGVTTDLSGQMEVFGTSPDGRLLHTWETPDGSWHLWQTLSGPALSPGIAVTEDVQGRVHVFGTARSGGALWSIAQRSPGGPWGRFTDLGGNLRSPLYGAAAAGGRIFLVASDGRMPLTSGNANNGPGLWASLPDR